MPVTVKRNAGHPWSGADGWDLLVLELDTVEALDAKIDEAIGKWWRIWVRDQARCSSVLFKPAGATEPWEDLPRHGTPREKSLALAVGDEVYTDFTRQITRHRIVERQTGVMTQTGCQLRVSPPVKGSGYVADNPRSEVQQRGIPWMDAAWFRPAN